MSRLLRLSRLTAALRAHVRYAWADDSALAAGLDADLDRIEAELSALADAAMAERLAPRRRTHCHCGAPMPVRTASGHRRTGEEETCGHPCCISQAREARKAVARYHEEAACRA